MDKYAYLRAALADAQSADGDWVLPVVEVDTIRALLAERDRLRTVLPWTAGALQACCSEGILEQSNITIESETKCFSEILDMADTALAQEGS